MNAKKQELPHFIETCSRIGIAFVFVIFLILLGAAFLIGLLPPRMTTFGQQSAWNCSTDRPTGFNSTFCNGVDLSVPGNRWVGSVPSLDIPALKPENQAIRFFAMPHNKLFRTMGIYRNFNVSIEAVGSGAGGIISGTTGDLTYRGVHERTISCPVGRRTCDPVLLLIENVFAERWKITVGFDRPYDALEPDWFGDITFRWTYTNESFVSYQLGFRYVMMTMSLIALVVFLISFCHVKGHKHADQKWMVALLVGVILLDNPLIALRLLTPGWFWAFIDGLFGATCLSIFMLHLLVLFGGFITNKRSFCQFYLPRIVLVGVFWCIYVATLSVIEFRDPTQTYTENPYMLSLNLAALAFFLLWALWYLYTAARTFVTCKKDCGRKDRRIKGRYLMLFLFVHFVVVAFVVGTLIVFFVPMAQSGSSYLTLYTLVNDYVWAMCIFMAPSTGQIKTSTTLKSAENPKPRVHPGEPTPGELNDLDAGYDASVGTANLGEPTVTAVTAPAPPVNVSAPTAGTIPHEQGDDDF